MRSGALRLAAAHRGLLHLPTPQRLCTLWRLWWAHPVLANHTVPHRHRRRHSTLSPTSSSLPLSSPSPHLSPSTPSTLSSSPQSSSAPPASSPSPAPLSSASTSPLINDPHDWSSTFRSHHVPLTLPQRLLLSSSSAVLSLLDTHRADLVACFIEVTSASSLPNLVRRLQSTETGRRLLAEKPRITPQSIAHLSSLPPHTLGGAYHSFLTSHHYSPSSRPVVRYVGGSEDEAWVVQRYREVHDVWHVMTGCDVSVVGELCQKVWEWRQTGLQGTGMAALGGALRVGAAGGEERRKWREGVAWGWRAGGEAEFMLGVEWERHWEEGLDELRQRWRVESAPAAISM